VECLWEWLWFHPNLPLIGRHLWPVGNDEDDLMEPPCIELEILVGERISDVWKSADVVEPRHSKLCEFRCLEGSRERLLGVQKSAPEPSVGGVLVTLPF
jgi:hypothetical protein